jgi:hypothetical protein
MTFEDLTPEQKASLKGDKGDKGDTGPQGDKGDKGDKGDTGAAGADGKDGAPGKDGVDGDDYILTDADKSEIAAKVKGGLTTADISGAADTNYTVLKARAESLNSADTTPNLNGAIAWTYA